MSRPHIASMSVMIGIFLIIGSLSGCVTNQPENVSTSPSTKGISLEDIILTEQDIPPNYSLLFENHTKESTIQENQTGNGITWYIQQSYDAVYYDVNSTEGVMISILELDTQKNAENLSVLSTENQLDFGYLEQSIETIGDVSFLLYKSFNGTNISYTYYLLIFSYDTLFIALGGSAPDGQVFIDYAKIIEERISSTCSEETE